MTETAIDAGMLAFYRELSALTPAESSAWPLPRQRAAWNEVCAKFRAPRPKNLLVEDLDANGVHVRVFRSPGEAPKPGVIYFHGGGWVLGSCETHDDMCAELAVAADCAVVLVDYRLAPEHPYPAQLEDSLAVLEWMRTNGRALGIDPARIVGAGDSAGGQMTVALTLALAERGESPLRGQVLIYPVLGADTDTASYKRNAHAPCLTREEMIFYLESFLGRRGGAPWADEKAVPNLARDVSAMPPTYITVAAHDPLCDDGVLFAAKLKSAGRPVALRPEPALAHSYMRARHVSAPAMAGFQAIAEALRTLAHEGCLP